MNPHIPLRLLLTACLSPVLTAIHLGKRAHTDIHAIASEVLLQQGSKLRTLVSAFAQNVQSNIDSNIARGDMEDASRHVLALFQEAVNSTGSEGALRAIAQSDAVTDLVRKIGDEGPTDDYDVIAEPVVNVGFNIGFLKEREAQDNSWFAKFLSHVFVGFGGFLSINVGPTHRGRSRLCGVVEAGASLQSEAPYTSLDISLGVEVNQPGWSDVGSVSFDWEGPGTTTNQKNESHDDIFVIDMFSEWAIPISGLQSSVARGMEFCLGVDPDVKPDQTQQKKELRTQHVGIPPPMRERLTNGKLDNATVMSLWERVKNQLHQTSRILTMQRPFLCEGRNEQQMNGGLSRAFTWCMDFL